MNDGFEENEDNDGKMDPVMSIIEQVKEELRCLFS